MQDRGVGVLEETVIDGTDDTLMTDLSVQHPSPCSPTRASLYKSRPQSHRHVYDAQGAFEYAAFLLLKKGLLVNLLGGTR